MMILVAIVLLLKEGHGSIWSTLRQLPSVRRLTRDGAPRRRKAKRDLEVKRQRKHALSQDGAM